MPIPKLKRDKKHLYTVEEYLAIDRASEERYEYYDGEIRLMAGETDWHGIISVNLTSELHSQMKGKNCQVRSKDIKIRSNKKLETASKFGAFTYPDVVVFAETENRNTVSKPKVVFEILPTEKQLKQRKHKFAYYQFFNQTLTDYVFIYQDFPAAEHYIRQLDKTWKVFFYLGLDQSFNIESIECTLNLLEIYDRIEFPKKVFDFIEEVRKIGAN